MKQRGPTTVRPDPANALERGPRTGFTLVEMLIVIAIIIVLLSLLLVGLNVATKTAQSANTQALLQSMRQGLVQFREDIGYYPPILDDQRSLVEGPDLSSSRYAADMQQWGSITSLAEYLLGYGHHNEDGYGFVPGETNQARDWAQEQPALGFRHPRTDGVWGSGPGGPLSERMGGPNYGYEDAPNVYDRGKVYGPYIDVDNERLLASIDKDGELRFPGDREYLATDPKVIIDFWGEPITYFRRNYPPGAIGQSYRAVDRDGNGEIDAVPTLSHVIRLRPYKLIPGAGEDSDIADGAGDTTTSAALESAEFAVFSAGPDRAYDPGLLPDELPRRVDLDERNRDNLVEVGP